MEFMKELINRNDIKILRRLLVKNKFCNELNTRKLNQEIQVKNYKFTKWNGIMIFVKSQYQVVNDKLDYKSDRLINYILQRKEMNEIR